MYLNSKGETKNETLIRMYSEVISNDRYTENQKRAYYFTIFCQVDNRCKDAKQTKEILAKMHNNI